MPEDRDNMNNNAEDTEQNQDAFGQPKKKKTGLIIVIGIVQLVAAVLLVWFFLYPRYLSDNQAQAEESKEEPKQEIGSLYKITDITVNPKNTMGRRFAVFEVTLEVHSEEVKKELDKFKPIIKDRFIGYFRTKTVGELASHTMWDQIKSDLKGIVNQTLGRKEAVRQLYFTRYVLE